MIFIGAALMILDSFKNGEPNNKATNTNA